VEVNGAPRVLQLDHPSATDPSLAGSKAAALAVAAQRRMPALGGAVLTTAFSSDVDRGADLATHPALREVFDLSFAVLGAALAVRATGATGADESALDPAYLKRPGVRISRTPGRGAAEPTSAAWGRLVDDG